MFFPQWSLLESHVEYLYVYTVIHLCRGAQVSLLLW